MKVKIMDYETAKAEVLAKDNPYIANAEYVFGIGKDWEGWGQVRNVVDYNDMMIRDVQSQYNLPRYLAEKVSSQDILRYGEVIINEEFVEYGSIRIRIISYSGSIYYHKMVNGEVVEFKEIGLAMK